MRFFPSFLASLLLAFSGFAAEMPIQLHDGLIWTQVHCGSSTLNFVVDTGAASTVVSMDAAKKIGLKPGSSISVAGVGTRAQGYRAANFDASVGGIALPRNVVALDLDSISRHCSQPIDGLIGADFFKGKVVQIDYARHVMRDQAESASTDSIPLRFQNGVMCLQVAVEGSKPRWTRLDTGCTDALHWSVAGTNWPGASPLTIALSASSQSSARVTVQLGATTLPNVAATLHAREIFPGEAGLLGNAALSKFRVTIDAAHHRLLLSH